MTSRSGAGLRLHPRRPVESSGPDRRSSWRSCACLEAMTSAICSRAGALLAGAAPAQDLERQRDLQAAALERGGQQLLHPREARRAPCCGG